MHRLRASESVSFGLSSVWIRLYDKQDEVKEEEEKNEDTELEEGEEDKGGGSVVGE